MAVRSESPQVRRIIRVTGTVQGVGFRPFVYRHAHELGLVGHVRNDGAGVEVEVQGHAGQIDELIGRIEHDAPPLAVVVAIEVCGRPLSGPDDGFLILESTIVPSPSTSVSPDVGTCEACLAEIRDPSDRRHRYPFTNCTNCGPRYTIVERVPYDRQATTMAPFPMCDACGAEYEDPRDRRFHAQPIACPRCGPTLTWRPATGSPTRGDDALRAAAELLRGGGIAAIKGLGGYHLAVDAADERAVNELRRRKARDDKPFAVMTASLFDARALCWLDEEAERSLASASRPIVLAPRRSGAPVAEAVAPGLPDLGVFLPYTPLHHLLLEEVGRPIVLTSGNLADEPIAHDDADAARRLGPLVDGLLTHDRGIHIRCDDSVVRHNGDAIQVLRRSRGLAPTPFRLPVATAVPVLAVGAELKSTVSVGRGDQVTTSHHLGDLEHFATYEAFLQAVDHLAHLQGVGPQVVAHDLHPEYLSTKFARDLDLDLIGVQHHHAHVASCLVEHNRAGPVLALACDGLGYGDDGTLWGGELLVADLVGATRVGHLAQVVMPGGVAAIREPWRMAASWVAHSVGADAVAQVIGPQPQLEGVLGLVAGGYGPTTSSVGRLFDALAAIVGCPSVVSYEAQAAIQLEALARRVDRADATPYPGAVAWRGDPLVIDPAGLVGAVVDDRRQGTEATMIAARIHETLGRGLAEAAVQLAADHALETVVLTGGVFQNTRLSAIVTEVVSRTHEVLTHRRIPPNDAGISIGQAAVAAARLASA